MRERLCREGWRRLLRITILGYLGRHNGVYEEPRKVLESIPGLELVEVERTRDYSLWCGGGGGRFWTETVQEKISLRGQTSRGQSPYKSKSISSDLI